MQVLHKCDNPPCCNPDHLFLGTIGDNMRDRTAKGRAAKGERQWCAKASAADVLEMRRLFAAGTRQVDLCARFGLHKATVSGIVNRRLWRHL